jgi:glycosyltransferase involved in cell wall biosynthesis
VAAEPLISVVIPAYNRGRSVVRAVESVRRQTHRHLEIIVVDDGSSDESRVAVRNSLQREPRLRVIQHDRNLGAQAARNTGIRAARGTWVAFLDSDDTYLPDSLERRLAAAATGGALVAHGECLVRDDEGAMRLFGTPPMQGDITHDILVRPGPTFPGMLVASQCFSLLGDLDESIVAYQEWDTAIRLAALTPFAYVADPTFVYDQRGSDTISKDRRRSVIGYEQVVRKHARAIVRNGGPRVLSAHLLEAARQHAAAGNRRTAWSRVVAAGVLWPFAVRSLRIAVADLQHRGLSVPETPTG